MKKSSSLFIGFAMILTLVLPWIVPVYAKTNIQQPTYTQTHSIESDQSEVATIGTEARKESAIVWVEVAAVCIGGAYIIHKFRKNLDE